MQTSFTIIIILFVLNKFFFFPGILFYLLLTWLNKLYFWQNFLRYIFHPLLFRQFVYLCFRYLINSMQLDSLLYSYKNKDIKMLQTFYFVIIILCFVSTLFTNSTKTIYLNYYGYLELMLTEFYPCFFAHFCFVIPFASSFGLNFPPTDIHSSMVFTASVCGWQVFPIIFF